jgi:methylated-DNA-protein-cysteine methyltransferase related protein
VLRLPVAPSRKKSFHASFRPLSAQSARSRQSSGAPVDNESIQAIWNVIARIPHGQVSSYGEVARAAGLPGRARLAGTALRLMPQDMNLPWHRVMGAGGRIVFPKSSRHFREQARLLRSEGVSVKNGRVARSALVNLD